ncbi:multidrug effflux MFS transporter [Limnobacter humi]|uniref:Bcr/CflA family efflux transporter n=1 Tax=Limnobacter humi TaxID=1778671 RepID=A0ABT1WHA4_9BURK|nr:multidrug effflux MFS transporter [Limnobacter humi]MCQ8896910.1 multidrug effflux MFS transporter [Limnobacter humi]
MIQRRVFFLLAALAAFAPLAIDLYLPSLAHIADSLRTTPARAQQTVSVFLAGFAVGMLLYGPLSDRLGRRRIILIGTVVFVFASVACALATSIEQLLMFRIIQAFGGGAAAVVSRAIIRDLFDEREAARVMAMVGMVTSFAPMIAPMAGAFILQLGSWRYEFVALALFGLTCIIGSHRLLPETLQQGHAQASMGAAFRGYGTVLAQPAARRLIVAGGAHFAAMFAYITGTPYVYIQWFGLSETLYATLFGSNIISLVAFGYLSSRWVGRLGPAKLALWGSRWALAGGLLVALAALPGQTDQWNLAGMALGFLMAVGSIGWVSPNTMAQLLAAHPKNAGAASALYGCAQFGLGGLASVGVSWLHDGTARPMAAFVMVFLLLAAWASWSQNRPAAHPPECLPD